VGGRAVAKAPERPHDNPLETGEPCWCGWGQGVTSTLQEERIPSGHIWMWDGSDGPPEELTIPPGVEVESQISNGVLVKKDMIDGDLAYLTDDTVWELAPGTGRVVARWAEDSDKWYGVWGKGR
jgi:hypothetical protein